VKASGYEAIAIPITFPTGNLPGGKGSKLVQEKREFTRVDFETAIQVSTEELSITSSRTRNISLGGLFIYTGELLPRGAECVVNIELIGPATLLRIRVEGEVVRVEEDGVAVRFTRMDTDSLIHLKHLVTIKAADPEKIRREYFEDLLAIEPASGDF
jgi:c-di-GMP-binding flagellar brake protein YcgR